ncbi:MAG: heavy-metal-associated domain-containing protein [Betaproteobacteria bacterium]|nr:MAG: heavy-metal-associated domain-containing protein [Betaproteobacteria bacterium]
METVTMKVGGMTCMACVSSVTRVLQALKGVSHVDVSLEKAHATVKYDPALADREALRAAVEGAGFDAAL